MLTLERKPGTVVRIGPDITILIDEVRGKRVRLKIEAPSELRIWREDAAVVPHRATAKPAAQR